jgi:acylphosphatase
MRGAAQHSHMSATIARHLRVIGRVQGVGYRWNMAQEAQRLGVNGWVRNRLDGSVEAEVFGPAEAVEAFIEWSKRGPSLALVTLVEVSESAEIHEGFEQRETA